MADIDGPAFDIEEILALLTAAEFVLGLLNRAPTEPPRTRYLRAAHGKLLACVEAAQQWEAAAAKGRGYDA